MKAHCPRLFVGAGPDWGRHPSSLAHLLGEVGKTDPVVWINSIAQRAPRLNWSDVRRGLSKVCAAVGTRPEPIAGGPVVVHPRVLPYHQFQWARALNGRMLASQVRPLVQRFRPDRLIVVATNPAAVALIEALQPDLSLYFCMDDYAHMHDSDPRIIEVCERLMLARADGVFATAQRLCQMKQGGSRRPPVYLPQGVDVEHFRAPADVPPELLALPRPVIGFQGIVGPRVDLVLLERIARHFPKASLVTVGKVEVNLSRLTRHPNFHAFPAVSYAELPRWIQAFDVGLVAYTQDLHTLSVNPLKLLEYLALGIPVVSVDLPDLAIHRAHVALATSHEDYLEALAKVLARYPFAPEDAARRRAYAATHSWAQRAREFLAVCDRLLAAASPAAPRRAGAGGP